MTKLQYLRSYSPYIVVALCCMVGFSSIYMWYTYAHEHSLIAKRLVRKAKQDTDKAAQELETLFKDLKTKVTELADYLTNHKVTSQELEKLLEKKSNIMNFGVAFAPYAFDKKQELYAPYFVEYAGKNILMQLEQAYDYTKTIRYIEPTTQGARFSISYLDVATDTVVIEYGAPFFDSKGVLQGVVFAVYNVPDIKKMVDKLDVSEKGFLSIIEQGGSYLYHPNRNFMITSATAVELEKGNTLMAEIVTHALKGKTGFIDGVNSVTEQPSWMFYAPIKGTPWALITTFVKGDLELITTDLQKSLIKAVLLMTLFIVMLAMLCAYFYMNFLSMLWFSSVFITAGLLVSVGFIWYLEAYNLLPAKTKDIKIDSNIAVTQYLQDLKIELERTHGGGQFDQELPPENGGLTAPHKQIDLNALMPGEDKNFSIGKSYKTATADGTLIEIPTGVYISVMELSPLLGVNKIQIAGIVWQRFKKGLHDQVARGVIMPQAIEFEAVELYKTQLLDDELIAWIVNATLVQDFRSQKYPFDERTVHIMLWSTDFGHPVVLVPDLEAYKVIAPTSVPQISTEIHSTIPEWVFKKSYFSFKETPYLTNFGLYTSESIEISGQSDNTDLVLNIVLTRLLGNTLILNLIPIVIIFLLLYLILVMTSLHILRFEHVLASIASLFFTAMVAYNRFYSGIPVQYTVFLGTFYYMLEFTIFIIAVITMGYILNFRMLFLAYRNMLVPQLLYWPIIVGWCLLQTLKYFY